MSGDLGSASKTITAEFDARAFSVEAAQKAAYRAIAVLTVDITTIGDRLICLLTPGKGVSTDRFELAAQEFKKDILDEQLRIKLKMETGAVRNLILGIAFSRTGLQGNE